MTFRFTAVGAFITPAILFPMMAQAHHGLDFLLVQTAHLPERGTGYDLMRMDFISEAHDETEFEPAVLYGATDLMTVELHAHYEKEEGESTRYESVAPAAHFRFTSRGQPFAAGLSAEYEFAHNSHDEDVVELAGVFGYETPTWNLSANILYEKESGSSREWGYAVGARYNLGEQHGIGVEVLGSFESHGSSEMMLGYYGTISESFSINVGIGTGIDKGPDWAARTAFIWRFK